MPGIFKESHEILMATGERPFLDAVSDRRYWLIHLITIPLLFISGGSYVLTGLAFNLVNLYGSEAYFSSLNPCATYGLALITDSYLAATEYERMV